MADKIKPRLISLKDAAVYLGRSKATLLQMVYAGKIPRVQEAKGYPIHFKIEELDKWIEKHEKVEGAAY